MRSHETWQLKRVFGYARYAWSDKESLKRVFGYTRHARSFLKRVFGKKRVFLIAEATSHPILM